MAIAVRRVKLRALDLVGLASHPLQLVFNMEEVNMLYHGVREEIIAVCARRRLHPIAGKSEDLHQ